MKQNVDHAPVPCIGYALKTVPMLLAALLLVPAVANAASPAASGNHTESLFGLANVCEGTAKAAYLGCINEKRDDFWIGLGKCNYISDVQDRNDCYDENRTGHEDADDECQGQLDGRNEVCDLLNETRYEPEYAPEDFVDPAAIGDTVEPNPFFPLVPGYRWVYEGNGERDVVEVLSETREIDGVTCVVVHDSVSELSSPDEGENTVQQDEGDGNGVGPVTEDTLDWYPQDTDGNVWYFGEISQTLEDGVLIDIEGSWTSGVEGAKPGIVMYAMPVIDSVYRQEFALGDAEDMAKIVSLDAMPDLAEGNPGDCSMGCLQTEEWSPLEPDAPHEYKYYQAGVGNIQVIVPDTGETQDLIEFSGGN